MCECVFCFVFFSFFVVFMHFFYSLCHVYGPSCLVQINVCMYVCKVRGDQIQVVPVISRLGGDASHGSHGAVAPVVDSRGART